MVPNCAGRSLEQIDLLFETGVSLRKFREANIQTVEEDIEVTERKELEVSTHVESTKA
jgi:hypothetical protein